MQRRKCQVQVCEEPADADCGQVRPPLIQYIHRTNLGPKEYCFNIAEFVPIFIGIVRKHGCSKNAEDSSWNKIVLARMNPLILDPPPDCCIHHHHHNHALLLAGSATLEP